MARKKSKKKIDRKKIKANNNKNFNQKNAVVGLVGALIFIIGILARGIFFNPTTINNNRPFAITQVITQIINPSIKPKNIVLPETGEGKYKVVEVIDGDTVELATGERFRFIGLNAPEQNEAWGLSSKKFLSELILNKKVRVEFEREKLDRYGRLLGYLWLDKILVNEKILEEGFALFSLEQHGYKLKYIDRLTKAEKWARDHHNGIWLDSWGE